MPDSWPVRRWIKGMVIVGVGKWFNITKEMALVRPEISNCGFGLSAKITLNYDLKQ